MKPDELTTRMEQLTAEHAALWRMISMSPEWRQLQRVEAQIDLLTEMVKAEATQSLRDDPGASEQA